MIAPGTNGPLAIFDVFVPLINPDQATLSTGNVVEYSFDYVRLEA